jgi:Flp pilus assembly pilin Flp
MAIRSGRVAGRSATDVGRSADVSAAQPDLFGQPPDAADKPTSKKVSQTGGAMPSSRGEAMAARRVSKGHPMLKVFMFLQNFIAKSLRLGDRGATAVEYGLIVTLIAVAIIFVVGAVGKGLYQEFQAVVNAL